MSRIPLGLWLCLPLLAYGCVSLTGQTSRFPAVAQPQSIPHLQSGTQSPGVPGVSNTPAVGSERTDKTVRDVEVIPASDELRIELGEPQPFPQTSNGPMTVQKPVAPSSAKSSIATEPMLSSGQRPIEVVQSGIGTSRILILGSIYGNDPESVELMDALIRETSQFSQSPSFSFLLIRTPNPDGLAEHIRTNHAGVDLNRNFPSTWFTATPNRLTGPHPASEIETRHLMRLLKEYQPHRVIHVRSSIGQRPFVLLNDKLEHAAGQVELSQRVDVGKFEGEYKVGSLEEFVTLRVNTELMTVLLPPKGFHQLSAGDVIELATSNFDRANSPQQPESIVKNEEVLPQRQFDSEQARDITRPDGQKGYVEILPPPPTGEPFNRASQSVQPRQPEFYELPPPPAP